MSIYTIYRAMCSANGKSYIGFDSNYPQRVSNHKYNANKGVSTTFYDAIRKHGWESFEWSIVYQSRDKDYTKNIMEEFFIREYNTHVDNKGGYNMTYGGDGNNGHCKQTIDKLHAIRLGKKMGPCSDETKRKISEAKKSKQRHISEEQKQHLREINTGKVQSNETRLKKSKHYLVTDPLGVVHDVWNLNEFCKQNNLNQGGMMQVVMGQRAHHKQWKCVRAGW